MQSYRRMPGARGCATLLINSFQEPLVDICYELVPYSLAIRDAYLRLLPDEERAVARGKLEWKLRDHPAGGGVVALATTPQDGVVGINTFMAGTFKLENSIASGFQSMDTIVSSAARGKGVFSKLVECFYRGTDADLIYGFPNLNSSPGFFGRLGWTNFGMVPMLFRPFRAGYFLRKLGRLAPDFGVPLLSRPDKSTQHIQKFDDDATRAWRRFSAAVGCSVDRDAKFLNWRLVSHPSESYVLLRSGDSFAAYKVVTKHGGTIGYLMEAFGEQDQLTPLIATTLHEMREQGCDAVLAWCLPWSPNYRAHRAAGLYPLPEKLRPIKFNFGAKALRPGAAVAVAPRSWYISYLDSDTV